MEINYGKKIKQLRQKQKMSQSQLASRLGVSSYIVSNWEMGRTKVNANMLVKICNVLNIDIDDFLELENLDVETVPIEELKLPKEDNFVGLKIREIRKARNLNQGEFASIIGTSNAAISNWERGENTPSLKTVFQICERLDVDANELLSQPKQSSSLEDMDKDNILNRYQELDDYGKEAVKAILSIEHERVERDA